MEQANSNQTNNLKQVPLQCLYSGMVVQEDIYAADGSHLLFPGGSVLDDSMLEKLPEANDGQPYVYVSEQTWQDISENVAGHETTTVNRQLELETGYRGIMDGTSDLLKIISGGNALPTEFIYDISHEMANRLNITRTDVIFDLINALAPVDEYLQRHVIDVGMLNGLMGRWLELPQEEIDLLILIGLLHDCGKAIVPPEILNAPRRLSMVEFEVMKMHSVYGYKLLGEFPREIKMGALFHHEKIDGSGYPHGLAGNKIPLYARITSVSDIYDAMVSRRVYKEPVTPFAVLARLLTMRGSALDGQLTDLFIEKMPGELIGKPVLMSNGAVGTVKEIDPQDPEYPVIDLNGEAVKSGEVLYCVAMQSE